MGLLTQASVRVSKQDIRLLLWVSRRRYALCRLGSSTLFLGADGITPEVRDSFMKAYVSSSHDSKEKLTSLTQDQAVMKCQLVALSPTAPSSSSHHTPREEVVRTA